MGMFYDGGGGQRCDLHRLQSLVMTWTKKKWKEKEVRTNHYRHTSIDIDRLAKHELFRKVVQTIVILYRSTLNVLGLLGSF